jgi:hypothetical protein
MVGAVNLPTPMAAFTLPIESRVYVWQQLTEASWQFITDSTNSILQWRLHTTQCFLNKSVTNVMFNSYSLLSHFSVLTLNLLLLSHIPPCVTSKARPRFQLKFFINLYSYLLRQLLSKSNCIKKACFLLSGSPTSIMNGGTRYRYWLMQGKPGMGRPIFVYETERTMDIFPELQVPTAMIQYGVPSLGIKLNDKAFPSHRY